MDPSSRFSPTAPKHAMASHFLRSLFRASRTASFAVRSRRIRRAAYVAMARSAGSSRAWSRALLRRLRLRLRRRCHGAGGRVAAGRQVDRLRQLVPGGAGMGACELLEEAADYVRCLAAQVWIMKAVVESISS